jgi:hypothetical protein
MTTVGDVLDEFFSPLSAEKLWIMPESDNYTETVRKWQVVIDATNRVKSSLSTSCALWNANFRTNPTWKPTKTDSPKAHAHREFVRSPPGTDPDTCQNAFVIYVTSKAAKLFPMPNPLMPEIQTPALYTCSIGSFNIYTTADRIDCAAKTATMSFWMYNAMSRRSFGRFATHPAFRLCGMATQYMWWNWTESVDWSGGTVRTLPRPPASKSRWS